MRKLGKPIDTGATVTVNADTGLNVNDFTVNYYKVVGEIKPGEEIKTEETPTQKPTETGKYVIEVVVKETANYGEGTIKLEEIFTIKAIPQAKPEMTLNPNPVYMTDEAPELKLTNVPYENGEITYASSDENVFTIDEEGVITLVGAGTADITVTYGKTNNYTENSTTIPLAVERADLKKEYFELNEESIEAIYTGDVQSVIVERTLKDGKPIVPITDVTSEDITIHYYKVENNIETKQEPINQGTYNVYITVEQTKKYNSITEENKIKLGQLVIKRAKIQSEDIVVLNNGDIEYNGREIEANIDILNEVLEANINAVTPPVTVTKKYYKHVVNEEGVEELVEVTKPREVGTYTVKVIIPEMQNYETTANDEKGTGLTVGTMTIIPNSQEIVVTIDNKSSEYGYAGNELTCKITSGTLCEGDTLEDLGITMKVIDENQKDVTNKIALLPVGSYKIVGEASNQNYNIKIVEGTYEVEPRNVTVKIKDKTSKYGEAQENLEYDDTDVVLAEDGVPLGINLYIVDAETENIKIVNGKIVEGIGKIVKNKAPIEEDEILFSELNAGDYLIVGEWQNQNYNVTFTNIYEDESQKRGYGKYSITPADVSKQELEITMPEDKIYNGEEKEVIVVGKAGIVGLGETINVKYYTIDSQGNISETAIAGKPINAGNYLVLAEISNGTNYNGATIEIGTLTVTPREITDAIKDEYLKYVIPGELNEETGVKEAEWTKDTNYPATVTLTDKFSPINPDVTFEVLYNGEAVENGPSDIGTYTVTVTVSGQNFYTEEPISLGSFKVVDDVAPIITLNGDKTVVVEVAIDGDRTYTDAGATAVDNHDGDITNKIVEDKQVDINTVGTYTITYTVVDSSGNTATETRTVEVVKRRQTPPATSLVDLDAENPEDRIFRIAVTELGFDLSGTLTNKPTDKRGITYSINAESAEKITVDTKGYVSFKDWGEASISITYGETDKYYEVTSTLPIDITRGNLKAENFEIANAEYTYVANMAHTVEVTAFKDNLLLRSKIGDYEVIIKDKAGNEYKNSNNPSEGPVNAGDYTVIVRKGKPEDEDWFNATSEDLVIGSFTIGKAKYDMTEVSFDSLKTVYNGEVQRVDLTDTSKAYLQTLGIIYEIECSEANPKDAGKYTVTAKFKGDSNNYEDIEDLVAEYEITKKMYTKSEIEGITMRNSVITYDENDPQIYEFELEPTYIANLGITAVSYSPKDAIKPGTYTVTIVLKADKNHEFPAPTADWAKPNEITRTVKVVENVTPPRISLITSGTGENERRNEVNSKYDNVRNPMTFAQNMKFRWNKGLGTVTRVDSTDKELEVIASGEGPQTVELKKDGIYKIEAILNPGNGEKNLVTTRYVRIARKKVGFKDDGDVEKITEGNITGIYYVSDVDVKISSLDNLEYISLDITADGGAKQTIDKVITADGNGNIVVAKPSGSTAEISYTISKNSDGTLMLKLMPKAGYQGKIKVDIKATRISNIIVDENKIEFESEHGVDVKTIDFYMRNK